MVVLIALHTKVCILGNAVEFCRLWGYLSAVLADRSFGLLLLVGIYNIIDDIDG
jgi:hypothetical protein